MKQRIRYLKIFGIIYVFLGLLLFFGLKYRVNKNFSKESLEQLIAGRPVLMSKNIDFCKSGLLGEPKVGREYIKFVFSCQDGSKSTSTLAMNAFKDKSIVAMINEYGRILNFDGKLSESNLWKCSVNGNDVSALDAQTLVLEASTIECYQFESVKQ